MTDGSKRRSVTNQGSALQRSFDAAAAGERNDGQIDEGAQRASEVAPAVAASLCTRGRERRIRREPAVSPPGREQQGEIDPTEPSNATTHGTSSSPTRAQASFSARCCSGERSSTARSLRTGSESWRGVSRGQARAIGRPTRLSSPSLPLVACRGAAGRFPRRGAARASASVGVAARTRERSCKAQLRCRRRERSPSSRCLLGAGDEETVRDGKARQSKQQRERTREDPGDRREHQLSKSESYGV